ncbi:MAG: putative DNA-binding protein [Clostridia bacterium]|nr:putative DNA-binding protein [Clostridia bacterium]
MDKLGKISMLYDFYGELLTANQKNIIDLYYNYDLSLAEISENFSISRQAVFDTLKRAENLLCQYEDKLKIAGKYIERQKIIKDINSRINKLCKQQNIDPDVADHLQRIIQQLDNIDKK